MVLRALLALIPVLMLTLAVPAANHVEPRVFGLPFLLVWIAVWVLATPLFLLAAERLRARDEA